MCIEKTRGCRADDRVPLGICASSDQSRRAKGPTVRVGNPVDWNLPRIRTRKPSMNLKVSPTAAWEYVCPSRAWPVAVLSGFLQGFLLVHRSTFPRFGLPRFLPVTLSASDGLSMPVRIVGYQSKPFFIFSTPTERM